MDAREFGRGLLSEVEECGLSEVLTTVHRQAGLSPPAFDIPALDALARAHHPIRAKDRPPVVELTSAAPGAGKSHLVYLAVAAAVLPTNPSCVGGNAGKAGAAVILDTEGIFDVERLLQVLLSYWRGYGVSEDEETNKAAHDDALKVVEHALSHVHVLQPQSLSSLVATLEMLPEYLFDTRQHHSGSRAVELIAIDSITSFFWTEKMRQEDAQSTERTAQPGDGLPPTKDVGYVELVRALRSVQKQFSCPVLATSWGLFSATPEHQQPHASTGSRPSFKPLLPAAWQDLCTLRVGLGRESIKRFPAGMAQEEAERDREARWSAVRQGKWAAWVDRGLDVSGRQAEGGFLFAVREDGVHVD